MRGLICAGAAAGLFALSGAQAAIANPHPNPPAAAARPPSAESYGVRASYRTQQPGKGYSARQRHMADCLATYRRYDPVSDRVRIRPGVSRRCEL
jgi:hypothetical protein